MASFEGIVAPHLSGTRTYAKVIAFKFPPKIQFRALVTTRSNVAPGLSGMLTYARVIAFQFPPKIQFLVPLITSGTPRGLTERAASIIQPIIPLYFPPLTYSAIKRPNLQGILQGGSSNPKRYRDFPNPHIPLIKGASK